MCLLPRAAKQKRREEAVVVQNPTVTMQPHRPSSIATLIFSITILVLHRSAAAQAPPSTDTLRRGHTFNSSSQLVSPNSRFTLGFHTPPNTNNSYLAVWYTRIPSFPVWIANRANPVPPNSNPNLTIDASGSLVITHSGGGGAVIELYSARSGTNSSAALLNTGNFVITLDSSSEILWQSFDFPTDVLLPGMKLGFNRTLSSWFDATNPAPGAFTLEWDPIGAGRLLIRRKGAIYWSSGEMRDYDLSRVDEASVRVKRFENVEPPDVFNFNFNLSKVTNAEEEYFTYTLIQNRWTPPDRRVIAGWGLDFNGDLRNHYTDLNNRIALSSECYGYETRRANTEGCQVWDQPTCRNERQTFDLRAGAFGPANEVRYDLNSSLGPSDCREACWDDCQCVGYSHDMAASGCVYWRGRTVGFVQSLDGVANANRLYVLDTSPSGKGMKEHVKIILYVLSAVVVLVLGLVAFVVRKHIQGKREEELNELLTLDGYTDGNGGGKSNDLRLFTYASIQSATRNFSSDNKLGQGGFGPVYKGKTSEGQEIAVKVLSRQSGQGLLEFKTELILISKLQHVNLVKLIGFCVHGEDKMIIYDFMLNKSLDFFLFSPSGKEQLNWQKRYNIIEGIAQGLLYLHKYSRVKIIHRDLKPSNILLDQNMNPKISDFGLARIFKQDIYEANTERRVGTYGYMAPEYAMQGIFSVKSDVYSFGVLILEIVAGRKNNGFHEIEGPLSLIEYAWELWRTDSSLELMDPTLRDSCAIDQLQRCIHVGLLCVENHAGDRPTIEDVISMLKNETTNMPMPMNPAFTTRKGVMEVEKSKSEKLSATANELTLSEIGGR